MRSSNSSGNGGSEQRTPNISMVGVGGICQLLGFFSREMNMAQGPYMEEQIKVKLF